MIRTTLFPCRALDDSHDALSVFEATVVEDRAYDLGWGGRVGGLDFHTDTLAMHIS